MAKRREMIDGRLKCSKCGEWLLLADFNKKSGETYLDGGSRYRSECRSCGSKAGLEHYHKVKGTGSRRRAAYKYTLRTVYGLDVRSYEEMYDSQDGKCLVCETVLTNVFRDIEASHSAVDHCHDSGRIRGLLCRMCNSGMGMLRDDTALLLKAVDYLRRNEDGP